MCASLNLKSRRRKNGNKILEVFKLGKGFIELTLKNCLKKAIFMLGFVILSASFAHAEPAIEWERSLGGSKSDRAYSIQQTEDGGYIVAGTSASDDGDVSGNHGNLDCWVVKLKSNGELDWQRSLGGSKEDGGRSVKPTKDGGYIIAGYSKSDDGDVSENHGKLDYWIVKLRANGELDWQRSLGGSRDEFVRDVQQTNDGGYIVAGRSDSNDGDVSGNHGDSDFWIVKLKANGELDWQKALGGSDADNAHAVRQTSDGGYIVAGSTMSNNGDVSREKYRSWNFWVVKLTENGAIEWEKQLGGSRVDYAYDIFQTKDDGYIVAGYSASNDGDVSGNHGGEKYRGVMMYNKDFLVVKLKMDGAIEWQRMLGGSKDDLAWSVQQTSGGGYIVAGYSESNDGDVSENHGYIDMWTVKLEADGTLKWQKSLGGSRREDAYEIFQTKDGGYIVAGYSSSNDGNVSEYHGSGDFWVVKLTAEQGE
jgi:uncharacterized delta-60 repeat protein